MRDKRRHSSEEVLPREEEEEDEEEGLRHNQLRRCEIKFVRQPLTTAAAAIRPLYAVISHRQMTLRRRQTKKKGSPRRSVLRPPPATALPPAGQTPAVMEALLLPAVRAIEEETLQFEKMESESERFAIIVLYTESHQVSQHETFA